jgi:hypothetical protein
MRTTKARKDRQPNWSAQEISALIGAKRELYLKEIDVVDGCDLVNPDASKWNRVSHLIMRAGHSPCTRDGPTCKVKWNQLLPNYKRIPDFHARSGQNATNYCELSSAERTAEGLLKTFVQELFDHINKWYDQRPQIAPPHIRDLLSREDANHLGMHALAPLHDDGSGDSEAEMEDPAIQSDSQ